MVPSACAVSSLEPEPSKRCNRQEGVRRCAHEEAGIAVEASKAVRGCSRRKLPRPRRRAGCERRGNRRRAGRFTQGRHERGRTVRLLAHEDASRPRAGTAAADRSLLRPPLARASKLARRRRAGRTAHVERARLRRELSCGPTGVARLLPSGQPRALRSEGTSAARAPVHGCARLVPAADDRAESLPEACSPHPRQSGGAEWAGARHGALLSSDRSRLRDANQSVERARSDLQADKRRSRRGPDGPQPRWLYRALRLRDRRRLRNRIAILLLLPAHPATGLTLALESECP